MENDYSTMSLTDLKKHAKLAKIKGFSKMTEPKLIEALSTQECVECKASPEKSPKSSPLSKSPPKVKRARVPKQPKQITSENIEDILKNIPKPLLINEATSMGIEKASKMSKMEIYSEMNKMVMKTLLEKILAQ